MVMVLVLVLVLLGMELVECLSLMALVMELGWRLLGMKLVECLPLMALVVVLGLRLLGVELIECLSLMSLQVVLRISLLVLCLGFDYLLLTLSDLYRLFVSAGLFQTFPLLSYSLAFCPQLNWNSRHRLVVQLYELLVLIRE